MDDTLEDQLAAFERAIGQLWLEYTERGPGQVDDQRLVELRRTFAPLQQRATVSTDLAKDLQTLLDLGMI